MSSFSVLMLYVWCVRLGLQNLEHKARRKPLLQRSGDVNSNRRTSFLLPCPSEQYKASWLLCSDFVALKTAKHDFVRYFRLPSLSLIKLISRWKKYPVLHKVSATYQVYLLEPQGVVSTEWAKCLRLCWFGFTAVCLLSASQTIAGSFCISFLLPLSLVLFTSIFTCIFWRVGYSI